MNFKPYRMAPDCPVCGEQDVEGEYRGARMGSTSWGHDISCCSDACGLAYQTSTASLAHRRQALTMQLAEARGFVRKLEQKLNALHQGLT